MSSIRKLFWSALLLKLILAAVLPLTNDEAYYWIWSQHMQLSYYDHPPFIAWLFWLGDHMRGLSGGSVRWPGVLLGHATLAVWLVLLKPFLDEKQRYYWLWLALLSPLMGGSGLIVTPDLPLMFFYAVSLWMFFRWRERPEWPLALAFGVAMGLGFASKYVMVLFALSVLPLVFVSPDLRRALPRSLPWLLLGGALGSLPVWLWNMMHDFASIKFQAEHGLGHKIWKWSWTSDYVLVQIGLIFPPILYWALKARRRLPPVFHLIAWVPLGFFFFTTFRGYVEANWPIVAYPAVFALAVSSYPRNIRSLRFTAGLWAAATAALAVVILWPPQWTGGMKLREFHEFDGLARAARGLSPLYARSYQMAAKLQFELNTPIYKLRGMNRRDFYDYLPESTPSAADYFLAVEKGDQLPKTYVQGGAHVVEKIPVDDRFEIWKVETP